MAFDFRSSTVEDLDHGAQLLVMTAFSIAALVPTPLPLSIKSSTHDRSGDEEVMPEGHYLDKPIGYDPRPEPYRHIPIGFRPHCLNPIEIPTHSLQK
ncbi:hypothetical protein N7448_002923 [Penicillium atrosanguineum]|nr:hypothetical protein N7526_008727 [Penicillium atrosanguineum]KAJ5139515.1 hypothetical protein N7448_002923 [Penicillium atrosanguineum]